MLTSVQSVLTRFRDSLSSRPRRRRALGRQYTPEKLEQRALLSTVSIVDGVLTYEAEEGEVNRLRIRPTRNATRIQVTEEARTYRNQPEGAAQVEISIGPDGTDGLEYSEWSDSRGNHIEFILKPGREGVSAILVDVGDQDDVAHVGSRVWWGATIYGGAGNDALLAGWGDDVVYGEDGHDKIYLNSGNDVAYGGADGDLIHGGNQKDTLHGGGGSDTMFGGQHDDELYGEGAHDKLNGGGGNDFLDGGAGDDWLHGHSGTDVVFGGSGSDLFVPMWGRAGRTDNDQYWGFRDVDGDGVLDAEDHDTGIENVDVLARFTRYAGPGDDSLYGVEKDYNDLQDAGGMIGLDGKAFWQGYHNMMDKTTWRRMSATQKREYWVDIREYWNVLRDESQPGFRWYRHNAF